MRGVADTNIVISGLLWHGPPRDVLDAARAGDLSLSTTGVLLAELQDVLVRPTFVLGASQEIQLWIIRGAYRRCGARG